MHICVLCYKYPGVCNRSGSLIKHVGELTSCSGLSDETEFADCENFNINLLLSFKDESVTLSVKTNPSPFSAITWGCCTGLEIIGL